jgi:transposase-like protein
MLVELSVVEQRYHAVMKVVSGGVPVVEVAERYGVSRKTVHVWLRRYRQDGLPGLADGRTACITTRDSWPPRSKHECDRRQRSRPRGDQC